MQRQGKNETFLNTSFLYGGNALYLDHLYAQFQENPSSVPEQWQEFFTQLEGHVPGAGPSILPQDAEEISLRAERASISNPLSLSSKVPFSSSSPTEKADSQTSHLTKMHKKSSQQIIAALDSNWAILSETKRGRIPEPRRLSGAGEGRSVEEISPELMERGARDSLRAFMLIRAYRILGHLEADLDPLDLEKPSRHPELDPAYYGFTSEDQERRIFVNHLLGLEFPTLREILEVSRRTYCGKIGFEYMHISNYEERSWIQNQIEGAGKELKCSVSKKKAILQKLIEAEGFEKFIDLKYTGTKRFGLDGAEATISALEEIIYEAAQAGVEDIVLGMAHRGRLNVLSQVMGKKHRAIFHEFKGGSFAPEEVEGSGDVKYHLGTSTDRVFANNKIVHLSLTANPSHLEFVDPVVLGKVRAKQDQLKDDEIRSKALALLIHGDAAFAGQGVVAECFGLSGLKGHRTGGSIHFIVNNQIGFTTYPRYSRSSPYPSDVAKMIEAPIFHVNGDDPESVSFVSQMALAFRQKFHKPVIIDMFCYRRFGHNEGDEPAYTQPLMYAKIRSHPTTLELYAQKLIREGVVQPEEVAQAKDSWRKTLEAEYEAGQTYRPHKADWLDGRWAGLKTAPSESKSSSERFEDSGTSIAILREIGLKLAEVPEGFQLHRTIQKFLDNRRQMIETGAAIDWSLAEALAFGSLLLEGNRVRLSGQDSERGTFTQRHSVLFDQETEERYVPLNNIREGQARYEVINSMLSEEAVLGFEYGYSLSEPNALTLWEAQFGDFANGAQVIFDQFISSGERKWLRMSGLVCLLPHGYEGQGPEHSSARLERFLQMCAEDNMQVANCSTPANYFHILRRQLKREFRKPLILMTPKSLLRHKRAVSSLSAFESGTRFHHILRDDAEKNPDKGFRLVEDSKIQKLVLCSGKVYYDLYEERERRGNQNVYLLRIEQFYPFPAAAIAFELARFPQAELIWCQEEPKNMGGWTFVASRLRNLLPKPKEKTFSPGRMFRYIGRKASAATATGLPAKHLEQLKEIYEEVF